MIIPWEELDPETLHNIAESFILREGTDYGMHELSLKKKTENLLRLIKNETVVIVWSELHETLDIKNKKDFLGNA